MARSADIPGEKLGEEKPARRKLKLAPSITQNLLDPDVDLVARARELREDEAAIQNKKFAQPSKFQTATTTTFGKRARSA